MTKGIFLVFALLSSPAFACPPLAGTWQCHDDDGKPRELHVTQEKIPGGVLYHLKDNLGNKRDIFADGLTHNWDDAERSGWKKVSCRGDLGLVGTEELKNIRRGMTMTTNFRYDFSGTASVAMSTTLTLKLGGQPPQVRRGSATCARK